MKRLNIIELLLPTKAENERHFFGEFVSFLSSIPNSRRRRNGVSFAPRFPHKSWPITVIGNSGDRQVQLNFLQHNRLEITLEDAPIRKVLTLIHQRPITERSPHSIELSQLCDHFQDQFVRMDHIGLNVPSSVVSKQEYQSFITSLGNTCSLHHYPTGQDWDFILPSSRAEWEKGISEFRPGREPKWEFVYDAYTQIPVIQLCIETKLTKKRLCKLLPDPYGFSYEGLPFRTTFMSTPWNNLRIRCDMMAYARNRENSWITGQWLSTRGKRMGSLA